MSHVDRHSCLNLSFPTFFICGIFYILHIYMRPKSEVIIPMVFYISTQRLQTEVKRDKLKKNLVKLLRLWSGHRIDKALTVW